MQQQLPLDIDAHAHPLLCLENTRGRTLTNFATTSLCHVRTINSTRGCSTGNRYRAVSYRRSEQRETINAWTWQRQAAVTRKEGNQFAIIFHAADTYTKQAESKECAPHVEADNDDHRKPQRNQWSRRCKGRPHGPRASVFSASARRDHDPTYRWSTGLCSPSPRRFAQSSAQMHAG